MVILLLTYLPDCMTSVYYFRFYIYIYDLKKCFKQIMLESRDLTIVATAMNVGFVLWIINKIFRNKFELQCI